MRTTTQDPTATGGTGAEAAPAAPAADNLTGAELAAAMSRSRRARRGGSATGTTNAANTLPESAAATAEAPAPGVGTLSPEEQQAAAKAGELDARAPEGEELETNAASTAQEPEEGTQADPDADAQEQEGQERQAEEPRAIRDMQARIDKLTANWRETERQLSEANEKLAELSGESGRTPKPAAANGKGVFAHDPEFTRINGELARWQKVDAWLRDNPNGGVLDEGGQAVEVDEATARQLRLDADEQMEDLRTARALRKRDLENWASAARKNAEREVAEKFSWSQDPKSEQAQLLKNVEDRVPELAGVLPGWKLLAAYGIDGLIKAQHAAKTGADGNGRTAVPRVGPAGGGKAPTTSPLGRQLKEAEAAFERSGKEADLRRVQALRRQMRAGR